MVIKIWEWLRKLNIVYFYMKKKTKLSSVYGMFASEIVREENRTW